MASGLCLANTSDKLRRPEGEAEGPPGGRRQPSSVCWAAWSRSCPSGARPPRPAFLPARGLPVPPNGSSATCSSRPQTPRRTLVYAEAAPPHERSTPTWRRPAERRGPTRAWVQPDSGRDSGLIRLNPSSPTGPRSGAATCTELRRSRTERLLRTLQPQLRWFPFDQFSGRSSLPAQHRRSAARSTEGGPKGRPSGPRPSATAC